MTSLNAQVTHSDNVLVREMGTESVLLNLDSESYFGLDEVGTRMWFALTSSPNLAAALEVLLEEYDVDADDLRRDLEAFVNRLAEAGLVNVREG